jgi:hypothetical protein
METYYQDLAVKLAEFDASGGANASTATIQRGAWNGEGGQHKSAFNKPIQVFGKALSEMGSTERQICMAAVSNIMRQKTGSGDVTSLLVTSISERDVYIRNEETQLLNLMNSYNGPKLEVKDWAYRIPERRNQGPASRLNPESSPLTTTAKSTLRSEKYNTLAFWGDPVTTSIVSEAMVRNQTGIDIQQQDIDDEMLNIRKAKNYDYWNGIEQKSFAPQNIPVVGGLLSRIFTNNYNAGAANLTDTGLQTAASAIGSAIGQSTGLKVLFTDNTQVGAVRAFEIARYSGNNPMAFWEYNKTIAQKFAAYNINFDRIYDSLYGPIPVLHDKDLPAGYAVMMTLDPAYMVREAGFKIGGQFGPWSFIRVQYDLKNTEFILDGSTLDDPAEEAKAVIYNSI